MAFPNTSSLLVPFLFLVAAILPHTVQSKPAESAFDFIKHLEGCHKGQNVSGVNDLKKYMKKYGYLHYSNQGSNIRNHANDDEFDDQLESAVKEYQTNYHLNPSGILDNNTVNQMIKPRCGVPDVVNGTRGTHYHIPKYIHSVKHFNFFPRRNRWPPQKTHLRYRFRSSVQVPGTENVRSVCAQAFQKWAQVTHFTFQEVADNAAADIEIGFHSRAHGDRDFDGRGGAFAHAAAPTVGMFHYDADEVWSSNPGPNQLDLESVAVHEIGHLLGLSHSNDQNAIMYAYFEYGRIKRDLQSDDVQGIRTLYGLQ